METPPTENATVPKKKRKASRTGKFVVALILTLAAIYTADGFLRWYSDFRSGEERGRQQKQREGNQDRPANPKP